ncbi:MAG: ATP-binding protein [Dehalococcoidales bacterium]|nr:ATP-binding protein [Dehalococcoidales bacterium]
MKEVVVISGKGGTGKTSFAGSLAALSKNAVMVDCDVDAADLYLLLKPTVRQTQEFWSGKVASIDNKVCSQCGLCQELCRFNTIHNYKVDHTSCEGCGFCARICPSSAITMRDNLAGHWFVSDTAYGTLVHARLGTAQENSGKLVATVRQKAREIAELQKADLIINDGPPGIGCPVISSLTGANLALLVTEPTLSGIHDLERILGVCQYFKVPAVVCINKYDIDEKNSKAIEEYCHIQGTDVIVKVPFDKIFIEAVNLGQPVVKCSNKKISAMITRLWENIMARLSAN